MVKKQFCVLLCLILILNSIIVSITAVASSATAVVGENLLANGGFESTATFSGSPKNWTTYPDGWGESSIKVERNNVYAGSRAARIEGYNGKTTTSIIMQTVSGLVPMGTYRLSFRTYISASSQLTVNLTYPGEGVERGLTSASDSAGEWILVEKDITLNEQSTTIKFQFMGTASEYVIVDDISFSLVKMPAKYKLNLRDIFNYSDNETGLASLEIFDYYRTAEEVASTTVNFTLTNATGTVVDSAENVAVNSAGKAEFVYDTTKMYVKKTYNLNATVYRDGVETETLSKNVYRYKRPSYLTADGIYMLAGEPFVPVIAYGVNEADYPYLKEIGVNTVYLIGYDLNSLQPKLQLCREYGMKVIIDIGGHLKWGDLDDVEVYMTWAEELVKGTKDDPMVIAYAQMDEPDLDDNTLALLERCYKMIRTNAPDHPIYLCQYNQKNDVYTTMSKYCDILVEDNYPFNDDNSGKSTFVRRAIEQSGKPVYSVLQTYDGMGYFPTADHIRGQMYRALEAGAKGIAFYAITEGTKTPLWATDRWMGLKNMSVNEMPKLFDYFILGKHSRIDIIDEGLPYGFYCNGWHDGDKLYIVAHNRSNSAVERRINLADSTGSMGYCSVLKVNDGTIYSDNLDTMTVSLDAQGVALYEITQLSSNNFGPHADFDYIQPGYVSDGKYGKLATGYQPSHYTRIYQGTVKAEGSGNNSQTYLSLDANGNASQSYVQMRARVEEGKNYVISFDTKTSNPKDLMVEVQYNVVAEDGYGYSGWNDHTYHVHTDGSEVNPYKMRLQDSGCIYTYQLVNEETDLSTDYNRYYEGRQRMWIGSDSTTNWTTNQIEIHVPCHTHSVEVTVTRNHKDYAAKEGYVAPCVDNFRIEEADTNLVVNGDFEKSSSYSAATQVMGRDGLYSSGRYPTSWIAQRGYVGANTANGYGTVEQITEGDNTYYKATAAETGMEFAQGVWLKEGNYKLSFKWKVFDNKGTSDDYRVLATLRRGVTNIPEIPSYTEIGGSSIEWGLHSSGYGIAAENFAPYGSTFEPTIGMGANQSEEDGWVNYEVYFDITDARAYWLAFGCHNNMSTYAVDDVVLEIVNDGTVLRCAADATAVCKDKPAYTRTIINPATSETTATVENKNVYALYKTTDAGARKMAGLATLVNPDSDINGVVITAVYEENILTGETRLYDVDWSGFIAKAGEVSLAAAKSHLNLPADTDEFSYTAKAFMWEDGNLAPLIEKVSE